MIGRRGPVSQHRHWVFLEIVRRQHVVVRRHESLEEPPGSPCGQAQASRVDLRHRQSAREERETGSPSARRRARQSTEQRTATAKAQVALPAGRADEHRKNADDDSAGHPAIEAEQIESRTERRLRCRDPFEQMSTGDEQTDQGSADRIAHQPRLMRQKRDHERGSAARARRRSWPSARKVTARRNPGTARHDGRRARDEVQAARSSRA